MKQRKGTLPTDVNGFIAESEDSGWSIWRRKASAAPWISLKVIHKEPIEGAANYWLGWHVERKTLARTHDVERINRNRPELLIWVNEVMIELYPTLTEADMAEELA